MSDEPLCNCLEETNDLLKEKNLRISPDCRALVCFTRQDGSNYATARYGIPVCDAPNGKKQRALVFFKFCPMCGKELPK